MKIGILTFHRAHNFGAVLQTYALQEILKTLGYEVFVIDYKQAHLEKVYNTFSIKGLWSLRNQLKNLLRYIYHTKGRMKANHTFSKFRKERLNCTSPCTRNNIPTDFDIYLIGSDQLWNTKTTKGLDPIYWGEIQSTQGKVYGYAISGTEESIENISAIDLKYYLSNFTQISFREKDIKEKVLKKTGINARIDVDPTLLTDAQIWDNIITDKWKNEKYILVYEVRQIKGKESNLMNAAIKLSKQLKCEIKDLSEICSPEDFVSAIKYATYIFTSSFHGTAFSLIFHKDFSIVTLNDIVDLRYVNLLSELNCKELLSDIDNIKINQNIDYSGIDKSLDLLKLDSLKYLSSLQITDNIES